MATHKQQGMRTMTIFTTIRKHGYTLVESLVVLSIIAIMLGMLCVSLHKAFVHVYHMW